MNRRFSPLAYVIFFLIALGVLTSFAANPGGMIVPLVVFGIIFWLWKFPPNRFRRKFGGGWTKPMDPRTRDKPQNVKKARFRVIPGSKGDDPDEPPKYH